MLKSRIQITNVYFQFVPIWIQDVQGISFTAICFPLSYTCILDSIDKGAEILGCNAKGNVTVILAGPGFIN